MVIKFLIIPKFKMVQNILGVGVKKIVAFFHLLGHKQGKAVKNGLKEDQTGSNLVKWGQTRSNRVNWDQLGSNRVTSGQIGSNWVTLGQTSLNRVKQGQSKANRKKEVKQYYSSSCIPYPNPISQSLREGFKN